MEPWDSGSDLRLTLVLDGDGIVLLDVDLNVVDKEFTELLIGVELIKGGFEAGEEAAKLSCHCLNCSNLVHKSSSSFVIVSALGTFWSIAFLSLVILIGFGETEVTEMPAGRF